MPNYFIYNFNHSDFEADNDNIYFKYINPINQSAIIKYAWKYIMYSQIIWICL